MRSPCRVALVVSKDGVVPMTAADAKFPSTPTALGRGVRGDARDVAKAYGRITTSKLVDRCSVCGDSYGHFRTDYAAPWLTILVVGHMTVPIVLISEINSQLPMRLALAIYVPLIAGLAAIMLPRCKGVLAALMSPSKCSERQSIGRKVGATPLLLPAFGT
jgi:uncharacterized protein (DUF983 family)